MILECIFTHQSFQGRDVCGLHEQAIHTVSNLLSSKKVPSSKPMWQWKMDPVKMYSLLKMRILHCHVSVLERKQVLPFYRNIGIKETI